MRPDAWVVVHPDLLVFSVARKLESPNASRGAHWIVRHRITKAWERSLATAVGPSWVSWCQDPARRERRRVTVRRVVPSRRQWIRDADNLAFAVKPIWDALRRLTLIADDSADWLEAGPPDQVVGAGPLTVITIAPAP